ncbi:unnamed protein product [Cylicocyclus nassatus]|uniref:Uncharacterized protein n=1 Tax=Cylicocyclus nassatus TaxID=53992 RepID=A0AA36H095_CYLNA|nr:unnamed protein product [Cylicocyclus nassatus]
MPLWAGLPRLVCEEMPSKYAVGIDLGTFSSCVAIFRQGRVEIIPNDQGNRVTPSYVAFTESEILIGEAAKNQAADNPYNTVFDAKRLIGRKFNDVEVQRNLDNWPYEVFPTKASKPNVQVYYKGELMTLTPEEISSMILTKLKDMAEAYLRLRVKDAVITVPASFNYYQRQIIKEVATVSGFNVLRIINETTAAAIAYGIDKMGLGERNVLIFDLGAANCSVSIVTVQDGIFEVKSSLGEHFGGIDFDNRLVNHLFDEFKRMYKMKIESSSAVHRLRCAAEKAKRKLSISSQAAIEIDSLFDGQDFYTFITRAHFEEVCADLFRSIMDLVERSLRYAKMEKKRIHDIVLIGGSSRIPKIRKLLSDFFGEEKLDISLNPDVAATQGAAIHAAFLSGDKSATIRDLLLLDATPFSLGIETAGGVMTAIIKRNTTIPTRASRTFIGGDIMNKTVKSNKNIPIRTNQTFTTHSDKQLRVLIQIFEGERAMVKDNKFLGKLELVGISPTPPPQIEVTFDIDSNGILCVTAQDKSTGRQNKMTVLLTSSDDPYKYVASRENDVLVLRNKL